MPVLVHRNGQWCQLPHKDFFKGMLKAELKKVKAAEQMVAELSIRGRIEAGEIVPVNGSNFRLKHPSQRKAA